VTHLAAAAFFTLILLAAAVAIHLTILHYWDEIRLALRGELGLSPAARQAPARAMPLGRAAS
jgi:hypothetical protein